MPPLTFVFVPPEFTHTYPSVLRPCYIREKIIAYSALASESKHPMSLDPRAPSSGGVFCVG